MKIVMLLKKFTLAVRRLFQPTTPKILTFEDISQPLDLSAFPAQSILELRKAFEVTFELIQKGFEDSQKSALTEKNEKKLSTH